MQAALVRWEISLLPRQDGEAGRASWYDIAAASIYEGVFLHFGIFYI